MNWKKLLLIAAVTGSFTFAAAAKSEAGVRVGIGIGFPIGYGYSCGYPYPGYYPYAYGYPYGYSYGYYSHYVFGDNEAADAQGYEDGLKTGSSDARRDQSYDPERSHYYKDSGFGNFAGDYRQGFLRGYGDGFHS